MTYLPLRLRGLPFELEWDLLPIVIQDLAIPQASQELFDPIESLLVNISQGDCFIPFDKKQSFSRHVNLLEVKTITSLTVKEIDNETILEIVNQAELKLFLRVLL
ncbi:hypothetical protein Tco_1144025 [Tanacetum coccineum]